MGLLSSFFGPQKTPTIETKTPSVVLPQSLYINLFTNSVSMFAIYTKQNGWIGANKRFLELFSLSGIDVLQEAYESIRELFIRESEEIFTQDDKSWLDYLRRSKNEGYHVHVKAPSGDTKVLSLTCRTYYDSQEYYILELLDITQLYMANKKTNEVERLKSKFLSNIGHEFRTPMNGILGFVELLNQSPLNEEQKEYIAMIETSSKNLMANIEALLDLSQMQGGRLKLSNSQFSLLPQMEELVQNYGAQAKEKSIKLLSYIDPKLPELLDADHKKIKQVMSALIQNAIKFTPQDGKVIVEVKLLKREQNGSCSIGFSVKDNGIGMSEEQILRMSEPFSAGSHADERLGVGLSLAHGIVELMGSELKVNSQEGYGSYFNFVLNFTTSVGQSYKMYPKKRVKVLLLDKTQVDEANFLTIYLRSFGIDVIKSNKLDENVYEGVDALYVLANLNDSSWQAQLDVYTKKVPLVIFVGDEFKLNIKLSHMADLVLKKPQLPSVMAAHLDTLYGEKLSAEPKAVAEPRLKSNIRALVVEDNLINQRLIQILLKEYQVHVDIASNGNEAVMLGQKNYYDIIFMDIDLPEKNGIVATKEIKAFRINVSTPIVALTAMALDGDREMLLSEGLDDYMSKPLTRQKLELILNKYLKTAK